MTHIGTMSLNGSNLISDNGTAFVRLEERMMRRFSPSRSRTRRLLVLGLGRETPTGGHAMPVGRPPKPVEKKRRAGNPGKRALSLLGVASLVWFPVDYGAVPSVSDRGSSCLILGFSLATRKSRNCAR
jgi:hypothetical protein